MSALPRTKPKYFADLSMQVAIIRPGPVTGKFVNPYIERRLGRQPIRYLHSSFKRFLERTLGVPLFQEQVMKIGMAAANLTGGEAEELRKAMGGKRSESIVAGLKTRLHEGMTANGFDEATQEEVMRVLSTVREFMFPESHAHSFASIAYSSAYTRYHFSGRLYALFNDQPMGFYSPATIANDARRHGVQIFPIDVEHSDWFCTLEELSEEDRARYTGPFAVRMGLKYVKGLRRKTAETIAEARLTDGPFASEYDLRRCQRGVLVDSNILLDVATDDVIWSEWSAHALAECAEYAALIINPIIYAEVSVGFSTIEALDAALPSSISRREPLPWEAGFLAGKCFLSYRKRSGTRKSPLPDFYIGAHAAIENLALLTRDAARFRTYFPKLEVLAPELSR